MVLGWFCWIIALAFAAGAVNNCIAAAAALTGPDMTDAASGPCETVSITHRGRTVEGPWRAGEMLLQTALRLGVMPQYSCMSGECGACMAKVLEGEVDLLEDYGLSSDEKARGYVLACQSLPVSRHVAIEFEA